MLDVLAELLPEFLHGVVFFVIVPLMVTDAPVAAASSSFSRRDMMAFALELLK